MVISHDKVDGTGDVTIVVVGTTKEVASYHKVADSVAIKVVLVTVGKKVDKISY